MSGLLVLALVGAVVVFATKSVKRRGKKTGKTVIRQYVIEPPPGRLGDRRDERL
jgi:hypothetical protein